MGRGTKLLLELILNLRFDHGVLENRFGEARFFWEFVEVVFGF